MAQLARERVKPIFDAVPSVPVPRALRPDLVLVALPPRDRTGLIYVPRDHDTRDRLGLVLMVGDGVASVQRHDRVVFDSHDAEEVRVNDWPCMLVTELAIDAVVED